MKPRRPISVVRFVLVLVIGMGMTLSAVQAGTMVMKMGTSGAGDTSSVVACELCGANDEDRTDADRCLPGCLVTSLGIVPAVAAGYTIQRHAHGVFRKAPPAGRAQIPDPSPPKPLTIV